MTDKNEKLRELYEETFGRKPGGNVKETTLINRLKEEDIDLSFLEETTETESEEPITEIPVEEVIGDDGAPLHEGMPVHEGHGRRRQYLVFFRGNARYWTDASIRSMKSFNEEITFPSNTTYDRLTDFQTCKSCG